MCAGLMYHNHEEVTKGEGREHIPLVKTLFHGELSRALTVIEPRACSHAIVELTDDRNHPLRHAEASACFPQEGSWRLVADLSYERIG